MSGRSYSFVDTFHYHITIIMKAYLMALNLSGTFCRVCVSKMKSVLLIIFHIIYAAVCIQLSHLSYGYCENMCTLSYYHHQIGSMTRLRLFRASSWNNGMLCMSFYILRYWCDQSIIIVNGSLITCSVVSKHMIRKNMTKTVPVYNFSIQF